MQIIDKNKDYYDHFSRIYGVDKSVTFDRRGSVILNQEVLRNYMISEPSRCYHKNYITQYFVLEVGFMQILFKIDDITVVKKIKYEFGDCAIYDGSWSILKTYNELYHFGKREISLVPCIVDTNFNKKTFKYEISIDGSFKKSCKINKDKIIELPILKDTIIPSMVDPFLIWNELSNYISSKNNDKSIDIQNTDIEKAVNHGFDKKASFRNPIKL